MNGGRDSRDPVDGERHDAVDAFLRRPEKRDALREVGHRVQEGDQDVPEQNPANCFFLLIWAFTGLFLDLFFSPFLVHRWITVDKFYNCKC